MLTKYALQEMHGYDEGNNAEPQGERQYSVTLHVTLDLYTEDEVSDAAKALAQRVYRVLRLEPTTDVADVDVWAVEEV